MDTLLSRLLDYYQISEEEYLEKSKDVSLSNFDIGHFFLDMDKAVSTVKEVILNKGKIIVYGDYDADGMLGTSILVKMFQIADYVVDFYIPNRYQDGYGLTLEHAKEYVDNGYNLVILVDNGISAFEPIAYLKNHNVKVVVLDHHQEQDHLPIADAICHPTLSKYGNTPSSGAYTAFIFSRSFLNYSDKYLATLAAISLISDMMPLKEYNRHLLRAIFKEYKKGEYLQIDLLADNEKLDENVIGMKIAPRINSIGRLKEDDSINDIVRFFTSDDTDYILNYNSYLLQMNEIRKNISKEYINELSVDAHTNAITLIGDYKEGIIGLIANNLVNKLHIPTIVFTHDRDGNYKGSARAPEGFDIVKSFAKLNDYLLAYGGHSLAGGCTVAKDKIEEFCQAFSKLVEETPIEYVEKPSILLSFNELTFENYQLISSFSPFGESWKEPYFKLKHLKTSSLMYSKDEKHILTSLGNSLRLVGFNYSKQKVNEYAYIDVIGNLRVSSYRFYTYLEFNIKELFESKN